MKVKIFLILSLFSLLACSDKNETLFNQGQQAYEAGNYEEARSLFSQIDSLSDQWGEAKKYTTKLDSIAQMVAATDAENGFLNIELDESQYQLIDYTCALFIDTPEERRQAGENNSENQAPDTLAATVDSVAATYEEEVAADDGMWYTYLYERQFDTLKVMKIPMVRVSNKPYIRFADKSGKTWTVDKGTYFQGNNLAVYKMGKAPTYIWLTDFCHKEIAEYFKE